MWLVLAISAVSTVMRAAPERAPCEPDYDRQMAELRRKAEAETKRTLRQARNATIALLALAAAVVYALAQLAGIAW